jgi:hypothetical protein
MTVFVFLGPTLPVARARELLDAVYLPPVQQGDVLRLLGRSPRVIGIVDGYFDTVPAVWHKEILLAMAEGVHVFGAASMGALRAAELHPFGMVGVGRVFEWYRDGLLTADDEVAVAHGPDETGYRSASDALVDIRDACETAVTDGVLPPEVAARLIALGQGLPYPDRAFRTVARRARADGIDDALVDRWLAHVARCGPGRKQRDAEAMLAAIRAFLATAPAPKTVDYRLERTVFLERLRHEVALAEVTGLGRPPTHPEERLRGGETLAALREKQLLRLLARREAERLGWGLSPEEVQDRGDRFRVERGLGSPAATRAWMAAEGLTEAAFWRFVQDTCLVERLQRLHGPEIDAGLPDQLRVATAGHPTVEAEPRPPASDGAATPGADAVSNPVVRGGERLAVIRKKVLLRLLAAREMERLRIPIGPEDVERIAAAIRRASGLETAERWQAWLATEGLSEETVAAILREFAAVERLEGRFGAEIAERVPDHIRVNALRVGWSSEGSV